MTNEVAAWLVVAFFGGMTLDHGLWVFGVVWPRRKLLQRLREHEQCMDKERSEFFAELDRRVDEHRALRDLVALHHGRGTAVSSWDDAFVRASGSCSRRQGRAMRAASACAHMAVP
jgi:hypothetical protein